MVPQPPTELSDEGLALFSRADRATAHARLLVDENDRWRRRVLEQLDHMFELGTAFTGSRPTPPG
jgi:hypothetical protein